MTNQKLIDAIALFDKDIFANSPNQLRLIIYAARENEQLRKERDELARIILMVEDGSDLPVDEDEWNCIVRICREAKKVNENGNA